MLAPVTEPSTRPTVRVEIWSDVVCPWCYIGKRRFERAVAALEGEIDVEIAYRPYQLDPGADPDRSGPVLDTYAKKFGGPERAQQIVGHVTEVAAGEGLDFRMDIARRANTRRAHRLLWLAEGTGHQLALKERLLSAYFHEGLDIGDIDVLSACASDVGMPAERVAAFLRSDDGVAEVEAGLRAAADAEITAVPTYVIDGRWAVPGAQDTETFVTVLRRVIERRAQDPAG